MATAAHATAPRKHKSIDLVEHQNDREAFTQGMLDCSLCTAHNALDNVDHQKHAVCKSKGSGHFVAEVRVSWRIDEVDKVGLFP